MEQKKTHGGARQNAGRKTKVAPEEKKVPLFIYPKTSEINSLGGKEAAKALCEAHLSRLHKKTLR